MNTLPASRRLSTQLMTSVSVLCLMMGHAAPALAEGALPTGGRVAAGEARMGDGAGGRLEINQSSDNAIINWNGFSIGKGNAVQINNGSGATLNWVTGADQSVINGALSGTVSVYVINPNGVIVGKTGVVKTGGDFVASTHNLSNEDFLNGGDVTFSSLSDAGVESRGSITSLTGDVTLIARQVRNEGRIEAEKGVAGLVAGQEILLRDESCADGKFLVRVGVAEQDGRIFLTAGDTGQISVDKQITASRGKDGGDIAIKAGFVSLGGAVEISGSLVPLAGAVSVAGKAGDGGTINVNTLGDSLMFETARLDASGSQDGGSIRHLTGADLTHSGTYLADGAAGDGGKIDIGGGATKLLSPTITANGGRDGGQIRIGGEFQGGKGPAVDELPNT